MLDAMASLTATTVADERGVVNGPEGVLLDWDAVDWRQVEADVGRLRQRIFAASRAGDLRRVRNLQKLMLRSRSAALVSVRRVTEVNAGRKTAGSCWQAGKKPIWLPGCSAARPRGGPGRSSGCSSRKRAGNGAAWGFP